jgi:hypothetical protein
MCIVYKFYVITRGYVGEVIISTVAVSCPLTGTGPHEEQNYRFVDTIINCCIDCGIFPDVEGI